MGLDSETAEEEKAGAMQVQAKRKKHREIQNLDDFIIAEGLKSY